MVYLYFTLPLLYSWKPCPSTLDHKFVAVLSDVHSLIATNKPHSHVLSCLCSFWPKGSWLSSDRAISCQLEDVGLNSYTEKEGLNPRSPIPSHYAAEQNAQELTLGAVLLTYVHAIGLRQALIELCILLTDQRLWQILASSSTDLDHNGV